AALHWTPPSPEEIAPDVRSKFQADPPADASAGGQVAKSSQRVVWIRDGDYVRPVEVNAGTTDGVNTAVTGEALREGEEVITGEKLETAQSAARNPFVPPRRH
ncbi:MAG TPA: RND transporter, partial [Verrucomicrobiae bacterium]|nr:RND transporter [Verrucomicrobiae bacterium]